MSGMSTDECWMPREAVRVPRRGRRGLLFILSLITTCCLIAGGSSSFAATKAATTSGAAKSLIPLRYASVNGPTALGESDLIATLIKQTKKRLKIQAIYFGALGSEATELASVEAGTLDMAMLSDATLATVDPAANITELPFFWKSQAALNKIVLQGPIGKRILAELASKGLKGLAVSTLGPRTVLSLKPIKTPADVQGLKIRVVPNALFVDEWNKWGANPIQIAPAEVFTALKTGAVSAVDSNASGMVPLNWHEAAHYLINTNHEYTVRYLVMSTRKWNSLPRDVQRLIIKACAAGVKLNAAKAVQGNTAAIKVMTDSGIQVIEPDRSSFIPGAKLVWNDFKAQIGQPLINLAIKLQDKMKG
jgi:tripartite ATP-independent transporter DctP family solute receptor